MESNRKTFFVGLSLPRPLSHRLHVHSPNVHDHTSIPVFLSSSIFTIPTRRRCPQHHPTKRKFSMAYRNSTNCNMVLVLKAPFIKSNNTRSPLIIRNTSNLPSDLINPVAQIILGFNKGNSLNLNFRECFFFNCYEFLAIITTTCDMNYCIHCCCSSLCATCTASKKSRIFL